MIPERATQWWIVRPRSIFAHPRLGAALSHSVDHLAERALLDRADRTGYDIRAVEQALYAVTPAGEFALGLGGFDGARILGLLWERLLPPRRRESPARGVARVQGRLGRTEVAASVDARCGVASWSEGDPRLVVPVVDMAENNLPDEPDARVLHGQLQRGDARATEALGPLAATVRELELVGELTPEGVALTLSLRGALPADARSLLRDRVRRITQSALLRAAGADGWCSDERVPITEADGGVVARVTVPWAAFDALAEVLRGRVRDRGSEDLQGF